MKPEEISIEAQLIAMTKQLLIESDEWHHREIRLNSSLQRHLGMDSLSRAELFQRIEKTFNVRLPDHLLAEADNLNDILIFLQHASPSTMKNAAKRIVTHFEEKPLFDISVAQSLVDILLLYAEQYPDKGHIYFQNEEGQEEIITYGSLLHKSLCVAQGMKERGLFEGDCVAIMQPTCSAFFYTFFGTLLAGGVPVPIYPPFRKHMLEAYAKTEARILKSAEVRMLVTFKKAETLSRLLQSFVPSLKDVVTADDLMASSPAMMFHPKSNQYGLIQYTSGSTSDPKGVLLTHRNLLSNIRAYGKAIRVQPDDVSVSWLPLYHDLGLIGMWLGSLYHGVPLVLMTPFSFLNRPERWLWAIHYHRGTISGAPNFAYELCIRKFDPALYEGLDLSSWRLAANGAEKIYPKTLEQFALLFEPYGFKKQSLLPVYGLAESCVGLSIPTPGEMYCVDKVDRKQFEAFSIAIPSLEENALEFVGCGKPIEGHEVRIVDADIKALPERHVGSLHFRGPSNMQGYYNNPTATQAIFYEGGWIDSGDLAYLSQGEIFITGRRKDLIVKAGRNLYPAEIEEYVSAVPGVRKGCVAVFSVMDEKRGTEQLIIVAETKDASKDEQEKIANAISEAIATSLDVVPDHVVMVAPHVVPKTSSGKLQRAACKQMYLEGKLSQSPMPAWMQVVRLGLASVYTKVGRWIFSGAKILYSGYAFILFFLGIMPLYLLSFVLPRQALAQCLKFATRLLLRCAFCPIEIKGEKILKRKQQLIYAANHASYIDSIVLMALVPPESLFVGKKELLDTPILKRFMTKLHYLPVDRMDFTKGLEDTDRIMQALKSGVSITIFPEGTFGYGSGLRPFRLGAFKLAVEAQVPICPIALKGTRSILRGVEKLLWPGKINVTVCDPISPVGTEWREVTLLRQAVRDQIAEHCGEPSLDLIVAQPVAADFDQRRQRK